MSIYRKIDQFDIGDWLAVLMVPILGLTSFFIYRNTELTKYHRQLMLDVFAARVEAQAISIEEELFQSLLPYSPDILLKTNEVFDDRLLFVILADSTNCSNGLNTDIQVLNKIHHGISTSVQGFYESTNDTSSEDFAHMHNIEFPFEARKLEFLDREENITPIVLVYNRGVLAGVHIPIPNDRIKSELFYKQWGLPE